MQKLLIKLASGSEVKCHQFIVPYQNKLSGFIPMTSAAIQAFLFAIIRSSPILYQHQELLQYIVELAPTSIYRRISIKKKGSGKSHMEYQNAIEWSNRPLKRHKRF